MSSSCVQCGTELSPNAKFCHECGTPIGCPNCGFREITQNMKFCPECGHNLAQKTSANVQKNIVKHDTKKIDNEHKDTILQYITPAVFSEYSTILVNNLNAVFINNYHRTYLQEIIDIGIAKNPSLYKEINDFLFNLGRVKDSFLTDLYRKIGFKFTVYNHIIKNIPDFKNYELLVSENFIERQHAMLLNKLAPQLKTIDLDLPQIVSQMSQVQMYVRERNSKEDASKQRTGLIAGAAGVAAVLTGGLAAPLMAATSAGTNWFMGNKSIEEMDNRIKELCESIANKIYLVKNECDTINKYILDLQKNSLTSELAPALSDIFNNMIHSNIIRQDELERYLQRYFSVLKNKILVYQKIFDTSVRYNTESNAYLQSGEYNKMQEYLSEDLQNRFMMEIDGPRKKLYNLMCDNAWWNFSFDIAHQDTSPSEDIDLSFANLDEIISNYQVNGRFTDIYVICNTSLYCRNSQSGYFDENKISNFIKQFKEITEDQIVVYYDESLLGGGEIGYLFTDEILAIRTEQKSDVIPLSHISNINYNNELNINLKNGKTEILPSTYIKENLRILFAKCLDDYVKMPQVQRTALLSHPSAGSLTEEATDNSTSDSTTLEECSEEVKGYMKSAKEGDAEAQNNLGLCYANGNGISQNYSVAVKWFMKSAEQNFFKAQYNLGVYYENGRGVAQNYSEAAKWYRKSAEQGFVTAQYTLGMYYENGTAGTQNYSEAVRWYRKSAEQGFARGQNKLGMCYEKGIGINKDYSEAVQWYTKSAEQGFALAQYNLGVCYQNGNGVSQNYSEAVKWYTKSAEQGNAKAQYNLAICYENGLGVPQSNENARSWYEKAAMQGITRPNEQQ